MTTRIEFADISAAENGWEPSLVFEQVVTIMAVGEGSQAKFNPIDTILYEPGATPYNSFTTRLRRRIRRGVRRLLRRPAERREGLLHVWNYPDLATGVKATADTFAGWPAVAKAITSGADVQTVITAVNAADGDQSNYYDQYVQPVLERWPWEGQRLIAGTEPPPPLPAKVEKMLVGRVTGTVGPLYLIQPGPTAAHLFVKRVLSKAEESRTSELGMTIRDYSEEFLNEIPNI